MMFHFLLAFLLPLFTEGNDVRRAFFVLNETQSGFSLVNTVMQDKDMTQCIKKDRECKFVKKAGVDNRQGLSRWYKNTIALPSYVKTFGIRDCFDLKLAGETRSGIYPMLVNGKVEQIPCDMVTDGGGWTIFQRRLDDSVDFNRNWDSYRTGFGDRGTTFWLGLDLIHFMMATHDSEMRIDLSTYDGLNGYAKYGSALIASELDSYELSVFSYSGTAGDALKDHNLMKFTTFDKDNDMEIFNCATISSGGFWYNQCVTANLNGLYPSRSQLGLRYMSWKPLRHGYGGITYCEMKFRRK